MLILLHCHSQICKWHCKRVSKWPSGIIGALAGRGLEIAWAADPVEFFFLQIQGSGLLRLPDGSLMRIGYAGQNGREYVGIGRVMRERGLIGAGTEYATSMQGIMEYIRDHPAQGQDIMRLNKSWIFFRELATDGPLGSLGVPVRREASVAVDPNFVPYGAPVFLDQDVNRPFLVNQVVGADFCRRVAQTVERGFRGLHAGVMQDNHVDGRVRRTVVEVGRRSFRRRHFSPRSFSTTS